MCVHTGAPGGFKQTRPVRMRNWNGTGILAINDPGTDIGAYFSTDNGTSWEVLGIVDDPRSIEDFATVTDSDGVLIKDLSIETSDTRVNHGLGRTYEGFIITRLPAAKILPKGPKVKTTGKFHGLISPIVPNG